jgi:hypothetical protein
VSQLDNHLDLVDAQHAAPGNKWMVFDRFDDYRPGAVMLFVEHAARARFMSALADTRGRRQLEREYAAGHSPSRVPPPRTPDSDLPEPRAASRSR